jgi:alanine dehydrogenase
MRIGVPREIKIHEYRVGLTPASVRELTAAGHEVGVQSGAGSGVGFSDDAYSTAGAHIMASAEDVFADAELIVKIKEPQPSEWPLLHEGQVLFTYLHLAADRPQAEALLASGVTAIAYETVSSETGGLPLLAPMSQVAGRMSIQVGAHFLQKDHGGMGLLLGGVPGVAPGKVLILGGGVAGSHAAEMAVGLQADVTILDKSVARLEQLSQHWGNRVQTEYSTREAVEQHVLEADLVIGAVLIAGAAAPKLIDRDLVRRMNRGAVLVDISIDQGGCFATSKPTTHAEPTYLVDNVVHYCVTNMPGAVARTSTVALNNATLPFVHRLADAGWRQAMADDPHLARGLNVHAGRVHHEAVARALDIEFSDYPDFASA